MNKNLILTIAFTLFSSLAWAQQQIILNPAINPETVAELQQKITDLETQLSGAKDFVASRKPDLLDQQARIENADSDTQKIIDDLYGLVDEFKTGSEIQLAVQKSMQDVKTYIDDFRAGSPAQQAAAASLSDTLERMEATDANRNDLVGRALSEIRRLEAMKGDLVALRIAGAFKEMADLYDQMVAQFESTVDETIELSDSLENLTQMPVQ